MKVFSFAEVWVNVWLRPFTTSISKQINHWKHALLFLDGRVILIHAYLLLFPYIIFVFKIPRFVTKRIKRVMRIFFCRRGRLSLIRDQLVRLMRGLALRTSTIKPCPFWLNGYSDSFWNLILCGTEWSKETLFYIRIFGTPKSMFLVLRRALRKLNLVYTFIFILAQLEGEWWFLNLLFGGPLDW